MPSIEGAAAKRSATSANLICIPPDSRGHSVDVYEAGNSVTGAWAGARQRRWPVDNLAARAAIILCAGWLSGAPFAGAQESGPASNLDRAFERCQAIKDDAARLYCYKNAVGGREGGTSPQMPAMLGTWHLVRTPNPTGGRPAVSVMQGADITRSDPDFAGLMLRCGDNATEALIVLVRYFAPGAQAKVTVNAGNSRSEFSASVVPPGLLVLLPQNAMALAAGRWQARAELSIIVDVGGSAIGGVVPLGGIKGALQVLQSNCSTR